MKRKILFFTLGCLVFLSLSSCDNKSKNKNLNIIDLAGALEESKPIYLSDFANELEYVPLETNDLCYLNRIEQVDIVGNRIFILDREYLYQFDSVGNFVRKIGGKGEGPGEYRGAQSFAVFQKQELIVLTERGARKMILFDFQGNLVREFKVGFYIDRIVKFEEDIIACMTAYDDYVENDNKSISFFNLDGDFLGNTLERSEIDVNRPSNKQGKHRFAYFNDTLLFWEYGLDDIYEINEDRSVRKKYSVKFDKGLPSDMKISNRKDFLSYNRFFDSKKYLLFIRCLYNGGAYQIAYDKETKSAFNFMIFEGIDFNSKLGLGFVNDIDGGWNFVPKFMTSDGRYLNAIYASSISNLMKLNDDVQYKDQNKRKELEKLLTNSSPDDNPILVIVDEKK